MIGRIVVGIVKVILGWVKLMLWVERELFGEDE